MEWKGKELRKAAWNNIFKKGFKSYLILVVAAFFFALITEQSIQTTILNRVDQALGLTSILSPDNVDVLQEYARNTSLGKYLNFNGTKITDDIIIYLSNKNTMLIQLLGMNLEYMKRNSGEVIAFMIITMIIMSILNFVITLMSDIGESRLHMENRFQKTVKFRRIFAPYGDKKFLHLLWVYFQYVFVMSLWGLTVIGFVYKLFQYLPISYLLAENPSLSWKEVKKLSKQMTKGYKWKMFVTQLGYFPLFLLEAIPVLGFVVSRPVLRQLDTEIYFKLRSRDDIDRSGFLEPVFDGPSYLETHVPDGGEEGTVSVPEYKMKDILFNVSSFDEADKYKLTDFIVMFFAFCLVGWLWEVGLHVVKDHIFINRGMMYGPWIPIYGFGGVFIIFFLNRFKKSKPKLIILTMVLCGILEYLTSFVLDFAMNASYWDYKSLSFNLNGRICLAGLCAFALGGFAGIYLIGPSIKGALQKFGRKRTLILCSILVAAFVADIICCVIFGPNAGEGVGGDIAATWHLAGPLILSA